MALSRISIGLAVRAVREAAGMTLEDLAGASEMSVSSLSRTENGLRSAEFAEIVRLAECVKLPIETFLELANTFEREGVPAKSKRRTQLQLDLDRLQRDAVLAVVEGRAGL